MPLNLSDTLVVGISATALFDLHEADSVFQKEYEENRDYAIERYRQYMLERENDDLHPGTGMPLVRALLGLNEYQVEGEAPLVEVVVMSRNSPETGVRVLNNIRRLGLPISRYAFAGGESVVEYLDAFDVDLFLTTNAKDAQRVVDANTCAVALVLPPPANACDLPAKQVRIAFDGDAVLFDETSELVYKAQGLKVFHEHENQNQDTPMARGPYASFLEKLARLQRRLPIRVEYSPVRIAIVTARNSPAELRVIKTLRHWGVYVNEMFFLGGVEKAKVLAAFRPHIFFDDQELHLLPAARVVPSGRVLYASDSLLQPGSATPPTS